MSNLNRSSLVAYLVAIGATVAAILLRWPLDPLLTLFPAIAFVAWYCGRGPSLLAILLGALGVAFFVLKPHYSLAIRQVEYQAGFVLYVLFGLGIIAVFETLRKAWMQAAEQHERLRTTLASIGDAVITTDTEGRITTMNAVAESLTGRTAAEAAGKPLDAVFRIINEGTREAVENPVEKVLKLGRVLGLANHTVLISRDGTERPIDDSAAPIRCKEGKIVGCVLIFRDIAARRKSEGALEESEERLRLALEAGRMGTWVWNVQTNEVVWPPDLEAIHGLAAGTFGGTFDAYQRDIHPEDRPQVLRSLEETLHRGTDHHVEYRIMWPDGSTHWVEGRGKLFRDGSGLPSRMVGVCVDITERKREEEEQLRIKEQFRSVVETVVDGIITIDERGAVESLNPAAERLFGYDGRQIVGRNVSVLMPSPYRDEHDDYLANYLRTGEAKIIGIGREVTGVRKDGRTFPMELAVSEFRLGEQRFFTGIVRDITERKKHEDRLRLLWEAASVLLSTDDPDAMLRELFANIGPHFGLDTYFNYTVDGEDNVLDLASYLGISEDEALKIRRLELGQAICGAVAQSMKPIVATRIQESNDPRVELVKGYGIRAYVCHPLVAGSRLLGTLSFASRTREQFEEYDLDFLRTICHYVAFAYERVRLIRQLREADRRKDEFLATLAHELRNPLAPIRSAVDVLRLKGPPDPELESYRDVIDRQARQLARLVDDLMEASRFARGRLELQRERIELAPVVQSAIEAARARIQTQGHELTVSLPPEPIVLHGDATRLAQVIANLLVNAAKYTEKGGHIWLAAELEHGEAVVSVRDTGIGIAAEHLSHVFEMFSQVEPARDRSQGGLGIGLSLVRGLVELHGGTVKAESAGIGRGSEFTIRLPVMDTRVSLEPRGLKRAAGQERAGGNRHRILVVDDNRDAADSLSLILDTMGHEANAVYDGLEAVRAAATVRPDVVLLDIGLPKMNGYEVARRIRGEPWGKGMALIALTGWGQEEDKRRALEAGFDHHLTKPVEATALERLLSLIHPHRTLQE